MIERVIVMDTGTKNKRQNRGSHLKNIRGSAFRKAWISEWLDQSANTGKHYNDAVNAYIEYKTAIANRWASSVSLLLNNDEPCEAYTSYTSLLIASKENVHTVAKALDTTENTVIQYTEFVSGNWQTNTTTGWMKEEEKYLKELTKPSGKTGKWIKKLKTLCEDFKKIKYESQIVPGLERIVKHCTYTPGDPEKNDNLPLYKYRNVNILYAEIARRLTAYSKFVTDEINNGHNKQIKT